MIQLELDSFRSVRPIETMAHPSFYDLHGFNNKLFLFYWSIYTQAYLYKLQSNQILVLDGLTRSREQDSNSDWVSESIARVWLSCLTPLLKAVHRRPCLLTRRVSLYHISGTSLPVRLCQPWALNSQSHSRPLSHALLSLSRLSDAIVNPFRVLLHGLTYLEEKERRARQGCGEH